MTKRELLVSMGPVPLDAEVVDEHGKRIKMILVEQPDQFGHVRQVMLTTKDYGHIEVRKSQSVESTAG